MRTGKNGFRRITAMLCALALCASMMPTAVFAEGNPRRRRGNKAYYGCVADGRN